MTLVEESAPDAAQRGGGQDAAERGGTGGDPAEAVPLVLLVEDDPWIRSAVRALLEQEGYRVAETELGEEALPLTRRLRPDVVLMDLVLPVMSGLDTVRSLKEHADTAAVPVIATSGLRLPGADALAAAGFAGSLGKPYRGAELFAELQRVLARRGA
ncbi:MAG TPA: response regulator [Longimicrobiaceae bacterium]|nr:response regulator [Longimicrobiaceae bacterium]